VKPSKRSGFRDPVSSVVLDATATREMITGVLESVPRHIAALLELHLGIGRQQRTPEEIGKLFGVSEDRVLRTIDFTLIALEVIAEEVFSKEWAVLDEYNFGDEATFEGDPWFLYQVMVYDALLTPEIAAGFGLCAYCGWDLSDPKDTGRPRKFCSSACRKAASRLGANEKPEAYERLLPELPRAVIVQIGKSKLCLFPRTRQCFAEIDICFDGIDGFQYVPLGPLNRDIVKLFYEAYCKVKQQQNMPLSPETALRLAGMPSVATGIRDLTKTDGIR
jgi:hypothetical protein